MNQSIGQYFLRHVFQNHLHASLPAGNTTQFIYFSICTTIESLNESLKNDEEPTPTAAYHRTHNSYCDNNGWDILCSIPMQVKALSVTYTRCVDATMHVFLDAMNQRDWVFTLYAIKNVFPHYPICMCVVKLETCPTQAIIATIVASHAATLRDAMTYTRCDDATMSRFSWCDESTRLSVHTACDKTVSFFHTIRTVCV